MGTNFYILCDDPEEAMHVGKRSAAGMYCWDCHMTLCKTGEEGIHLGCCKKGHVICDCGWYSSCPSCGRKAKKKEPFGGAVFRELGLNKSMPVAKKGVASCCSFTWAMPFETLAEAVTAIQDNKVIRDEYGRGFTWHEFLMVLDECPVRYLDQIGEVFS